MYLETKVIRNFRWIYHIKATTQCFEFWKAAIMDQSVTFRKRIYTKESVKQITSCYPGFSLVFICSIYTERRSASETAIECSFYYFIRSEPTYKSQCLKLLDVIAACNQLNMNDIKATFHLRIFMRGERATGKIQRNNCHHGSCGPV